MELIYLCEILLTGAFIQEIQHSNIEESEVYLYAIAAANNYKDFLISWICHRPSVLGSLAEEYIDCSPDAVIDIIWARVALLGRDDLCDNNFDYMVADIIKGIPDIFDCPADLPFVACHGNRNCAVDRSMANQSFPDCEFAGHVGFQSDTLYVRYKCLKLENPIQLPSDQSVTGRVIDILSAKFLDNSSPKVQDFFCTISPMTDVGNVSLQINVKLANLSSVEIVELEQPGDETVKLIPFNGAYKIRNEIHTEAGENWTLRYRRDAELKKGSFWIQITATQTNSSGFVPLRVACGSSATSTMKAAESEQKGKSLDKYLVIGLSAGGALLLIILVITVMTVARRSRKRQNDSQRSKLSSEPSPAPTSNIGVYATASAIDEESNQSKKPHQQNKYVNASPDILYSAVDKDRKSDKGTSANDNTTMSAEKGEAKNVNDDETLMFENNTLYSSTSGKDASDVGVMEQTAK